MLKIFNTFGRKIPTNSGSLLEISKNVKIPNVNSQRESSGGFHSKYVSKLKQFLPNPNYRIKFVRPKDYECVAQFIKDHFYCSDPLSVSLTKTDSGNLAEDPILDQLIRDEMEDGYSLMAVSTEGYVKDEIVGVCINSRNCIWTGDNLIDSTYCTDSVASKKLLNIWGIVSREPYLRKKFKHQNVIFDLSLLCIRDNEQNKGVGLALTMNSIELARDCGYDLARFDCTSDFCSKLAEKNQMDILWQIPYCSLVDCDDNPIQPEAPHSHVCVYGMNLKKVQPIYSCL